MDITYIIIAPLIFLVIGVLDAVLKKRASRVRIEKIEERTYRTSKLYWTLTLFVGGFIIWASLSTAIEHRANGGETGILLGFIEMLIVTSPLGLLFVLMTYCGFRQYVTIQDGQVYTFDGFKRKEFSQSGILSCNTSWGMIQIVHAQNPAKPIQITCGLADLSTLLATFDKIRLEPIGSGQ